MTGRCGWRCCRIMLVLFRLSAELLPWLIEELILKISAMRKVNLTSKSVLFQEFIFFILGILAVAVLVYLLVNLEWLLLVIGGVVFFTFRSLFNHLPRVVSIDHEYVHVSKLLIFSKKISLTKLKKLKWNSPVFVLEFDDGTIIPVQDQWDTEIMPGYGKEVRERELRRKMSPFIKL